MHSPGSVRYRGGGVYKNCKNYQIFKGLESSFDRLNEASWNIRQMENNYHNADQFRWAFNGFLRTLKEIISMLSAELQNDNQEIKKIIKSKKEELKNDLLVSFLSKKRDFVVHRSMLKPESKGYIGYFRGSTLKLGLKVPINPLDDSLKAMERYIYILAKDEIDTGSGIFPVLQTEEDGSGEYTGIQREWKLPDFPDELLILATKAWNKVASVVFNIAITKGAELTVPVFETQDINKTQIELYDPEWISEKLEEARKYYRAND